MPGVTVIDSLIVKLGLDPRDFTKGSKEAAAAVVRTEDVVEKSSQSMGGQLTALAGKWLKVAAAITAIRAGVNIIDDVATRTRRLGIDAKNYGFAANELRNFENAVADFGGNAEDARKSIAGFNKSIFDLAYNGQMSDGLVMLARLGVQFQDAGGKARNFKDIALDTAGAIETAQKQGMSREDAFQFLQQAGFDQGTSQLLLEGRAGAQAALDKQAARRQVSGEDVDKATGISRARIGKEQALEGVKIAGMDFAGGLQEGINGFIEKLASPGGASAALGDLTSKVTKLGDAVDNFIIRQGGGTRGLRNNNPGNIRAVGNQNHDRSGFRVNGTMEEGITEADEQLDRYAKRGINTLGKIIATWAPPSENDTKKYIADVMGDTGLKEDSVIDAGNRALFLASMFKHESGAKSPGSSEVADALQSRLGDDGQYNPDGALGASPSPSAQASASNNRTDVQIDSITVNTQATDAEAIAGGIDGAVKRKVMVGHAETGMQ